MEFFEGLRADNTKAYWNAHKEFYEASVRGPMAELLDELSGEFGPGRIARPYRDIRFRADKSPYKTEIYATLALVSWSYLTGIETCHPSRLRKYARNSGRFMLRHDRDGTTQQCLTRSFGDARTKGSDNPLTPPG